MLGTMSRTIDAKTVDKTRQIVDLARDFSIEVTPKQALKVASFKAILPEATRVFVAFIPGESKANMAATVKRLREDGLRPVPHVPARSLEDLSDFEAYVRDLRAAGAKEALVIAGGLNAPVGALTSSLQLLDSGAFEVHGFEGLFVAGHPEGSPDIDAAGLSAALAHKNAHAERTGTPLTLTTQFSFDAPRVLAWAEAIGEAGNRLPARIGVAGPASITSLMKYAKMCGVNASMGVIAKAGGKMLQLMGQSAPDIVITDLATKRRGHGRAVQSLHFYPFGGFEKTARYATSLAEGRIVLDRDGEGFDVAA